MEGLSHHARISVGTAQIPMAGVQYAFESILEQLNHRDTGVKSLLMVKEVNVNQLLSPFEAESEHSAI